jgi:hypothetical protein
VLVIRKALHDALKGDDDDLYSTVVLPVQLPGSMMLLLLMLKRLLKVSSNSSIRRKTFGTIPLSSTKRISVFSLVLPVFFRRGDNAPSSKVKI